MKEVSLIEAWSQWSAGTQLSEYLLWGIKILWWGRMGKLLELFGALTIVAEIIGPARLRAFGKTVNLIRLPNSDKQVEKGWVDNTRMLVFFIIYCSILVILGVVKSHVFPTWDSPAQAWWILLIRVAVLPVIWLAIIVGTIYSMEFVILRPVARILENEYLDKTIKVLGVALVLIGFHFDLLAS